MHDLKRNNVRVLGRGPRTIVMGTRLWVRPEYVAVSGPGI